MKVINKREIYADEIYLIYEIENDFHFQFVVSLTAYSPSHMVCTIVGDGCQIRFIITETMLKSNSVNQVRTTEHFTYYELEVFRQCKEFINNSLPELFQMVVRKWLI